jgi:hypothetical protein
MTVPSVDNTVLDNQLGIRAPSGAVLAIIASASSGDVAAPASYTQIKDLQTAHTRGRLVEGGAYAIERYGLTVLAVRCTASTAGGYGTLTVSFTGTSVPTLDTAVHPEDDYEIVVVFPKGGTRGTTGITYQVSHDGGVTFGIETALGTATSITVPDGGGKIDLATGTIDAGDQLSFPTTAPKWNATDLDAALQALKVTQSIWTSLVVFGACDSTALSTIDAKLEAMADTRPRRAVAHFRNPNAGETEAQYLTAFQALAATSSSRRTALCAGAARVDSSVSRRRYRTTAALAIAPLLASVTEEIDLAELAYGPLPGVFIRDANGNPDEHDEFINPGLDDARGMTLRSWEGRSGVWVNNPRLFSPVGSDFIYIQYGRIIDLACVIVRAELEPILSRAIEVLPDGTGRVKPAVLRSIEGQVNGKLRAALVGARKATSATLRLSRTDNVLQTGQLSYEVRVVPLAYPKKIKGTTALVASESAAATAAG